MIPRGDRLSLGVPAMVLAGAEAEGAPAVRSLDDPRGWVSKGGVKTRSGGLAWSIQ